MNKEEFIKLLQTLDFEELRCATISYYKKKPSKYSSYGDEDYSPKTICIGTDLERLINEEHSYTCNLFEEAIRRINDNLIISSILDGKKYYTINNYSFDYRELLDILKEVE